MKIMNPAVYGSSNNSLFRTSDYPLVMSLVIGLQQLLRGISCPEPVQVSRLTYCNPKPQLLLLPRRQCTAAGMGTAVNYISLAAVAGHDNVEF